MGLFLIFLGSASAASFYVPLNKTKGWSWETFYLAESFIAWILMPLGAALYATSHLFEVYSASPPGVLAVTFGLGVVWGIGQLMFGLSMRYLGLSLGYAITLGTCAVVGTIVPSIMEDKFIPMLTEWPNVLVPIGICISVIGIAVCGWAGMMKEKEVSEEQKKTSVKEFHLFKGLTVALISGIVVSSFAIGFSAGKEISQIAVRFGASELYKNNTIFLLMTMGGFLANTAGCIFVGFKKNTLKEYHTGSAGDLSKNYALITLSGILWYAQFIFYGMGVTKLGRYDFTAWSIHMALMIALSNLWGIKQGEWKGISRTNWLILWSGICILVISAIVIGLGNNLVTDK